MSLIGKSDHRVQATRGGSSGNARRPILASTCTTGPNTAIGRKAGSPTAPVFVALDCQLERWPTRRPAARKRGRSDPLPHPPPPNPHQFVTVTNYPGPPALSGCHPIPAPAVNQRGLVAPAPRVRRAAPIRWNGTLMGTETRGPQAALHAPGRFPPVAINTSL